MRVRRRISYFIAFIIGLFVGLRQGTRNRSFSRYSLSANERLHNLVGSDSPPLPVDRVSVPRRLHRKYLAEYSVKIDGWFNREVLYAVWTISQFQYQNLTVFGGIGEIGVHHGKLTCYLYLMRRYREQILFAVDVFENQSLNKDGSGHGQKDVFLRNIATYAHVDPNELTIYSGSSLDLNPVFSQRSEAIKWWIEKVIDQRGLQLISVDGGHTTLLTYSDLCLASNALMEGGVVIVDDFTHSGWLGVRDGTNRFLSETSSPLNDPELEEEMSRMPNQTSLALSQRIVEATTMQSAAQNRNNCSRLVPFLQFSNKLFLTTAKYYPRFIELLGGADVFANEAREISCLKYNAFRLTVGNVPVWTDNPQLSAAQISGIFQRIIEPQWMSQIDASGHYISAAKQI